MLDACSFSHGNKGGLATHHVGQIEYADSKISLIEEKTSTGRMELNFQITSNISQIGDGEFINKLEL
jgi:hypothetical protein